VLAGEKAISCSNNRLIFFSRKAVPDFLGQNENESQSNPLSLGHLFEKTIRSQ
jgi:hypothetical protein